MIWQSAAEFWAMGGYGAFVWGSVGVTALLLALEVWWVRQGRQQALKAVCEAIDADLQDAKVPPTSAAYPAADPAADHVADSRSGVSP
jgi:heme exporter protein D